MEAPKGEGADAHHVAGSTPGQGVATEPGRLAVASVLRFVDIAVDALAVAREEIDALNVYPVPDGDTGTNMYLTIAAARDAIRDAADRPADEALATFARGALLGARGNSGVILSEMLGALARRLARAGAEDRFAMVVAEGLAEATTACYAAVGEPVEGTMLTVLRVAADAAMEAGARSSSHTRDVFIAAAAAAREALARTPDQLEVLARAGVVDAGGRGLCVLLDAAERVFTGRRVISVPPSIGRRATAPVPVPVPTPAPDSSGPAEGDLCADGPAYEVMYLLETDDDRVAQLRTELGRIGDSVVVVGREGLWNVHVHTDDVGAAIEAALDIGRPSRIRVTHFAEQVAGPPHERPTESLPRAVVAVAAGPGLARLFESAGAVVVPATPTRRPSTGELLTAIAASGAREVVVLPNDDNTIRAAQAAATTAETDDQGPSGIRVAVIPTHAQVEGLAALAVHDLDSSFEHDVTEMTATARHVRHGAVTVAAREAMTMAGPCVPGDVLGVIAGDFAVVGDDQGEVAVEVLRRLLAAGGELVTLVGGEDGGDALVAQVAAWVEEHHPHVDVMSYDGGQDRYPLLLSVE
ncbi:DAK2 domain-containing protein [Nocardioides sambongensis]|uniref:DAK2 domain-containing protein n=1 Tax=Nocardioides sambongensis TaxID=2589074 RepID=UPI00112ECB4C|nr:DAK2 domain-containing protein [Nocardioides sambongensis]